MLSIVKSVTIAEFKRDLPALLEAVGKGNTIVLQKGRRREPVAVLAPISRLSAPERRLGLLAKRGKPVFRDWRMTEEDFLDS